MCSRCHQSAAWRERHGKTANYIIVAYAVGATLSVGYSWLYGWHDPATVAFVAIAGPFVVAIGGIFALCFSMLLYTAAESMLIDLLGVIDDWRASSRSPRP